MVDIAHSTNNIFRHIPLADGKILEKVHYLFVNLHRPFQVRVAVRYKISLANPVKIAHTAIGSAFHTDILPQIVVA